MSVLFISHSSQDNDTALSLGDKLESWGHKSLFLDVDPEHGIAAGARWRQELYRQVLSCQAALVLCSAASVESKWCFAEITMALAHGKHVVPVMIEPCAIPSILSSTQVLDITKPYSESDVRLKRALLDAGLDPESAYDWSGRRAPYPGLASFEMDDASVFFGREEEATRLHEIVRHTLDFGGTRALFVLGASGSGKSSLVKAGLLPKLTRSPENWLLLPPMRAGPRPFEALGSALAGAFKHHSVTKDAAGLASSLSGEVQSGAEALLDMLEELRRAASAPAACPVVVVDQAEELVVGVPVQESGRFLALISRALSAARSRPLVVFTLRTDLLPDFELLPGVEHLARREYLVRPLSRDRWVDVIRKPAEVAGIRLERGLVDALLQDAVNQDALPLLAFALRELHESYASDGLIEVEEYRSGLGGLDGAIAKVAHEILEANPLSEQESRDLRRSFLQLARVSPEGVVAKTSARWDDLPKSVHGVLHRFLEKRLLVPRDVNGERAVEVTHDALFRSWDELAGWIREDTTFLLWRQRTASAIEEWERTDRDPSALLRGRRLHEAIEAHDAHEEDISSREVEFIEASVQEELRTRPKLHPSLFPASMNVIRYKPSELLEVSCPVTRMNFRRVGCGGLGVLSLCALALWSHMGPQAVNSWLMLIFAAIMLFGIVVVAFQDLRRKKLRFDFVNKWAGFGGVFTSEPLKNNAVVIASREREEGWVARVLFNFEHEIARSDPQDTKRDAIAQVRPFALALAHELGLHYVDEREDSFLGLDEELVRAPPETAQASD